MASLQDGTHIFIFFAFIVQINQNRFISLSKEYISNITRKLKKLYFRKLLLYLRRPFKALQLALVTEYL